MIFHADSQTFERRVPYTYPASLVRLCIEDFDYRLRYHIDSLVSTALTPKRSRSGAARARSLQAPSSRRFRTG